MRTQICLTELYLWNNWFSFLGRNDELLANIEEKEQELAQKEEEYSYITYCVFLREKKKDHWI